MGIALQSYSVTADEWTLIASNVSELSFQNIGQFPVYVNFSSAANTEPSSSVGLVYQPGNGELQKSLSELLYATGGDLWYVWCKAISKQSKVLATDGIELLARTIYPDATGKLVLPDEARTTDLYAPDHEGVYRKFESGEPAVVGGRVVRQLLSNSENLASGWTTFASASIGSQQPDGSWEITIAASGLSGIYQSFASLSGENLIGSIEVKRGTYTGNIELGNPAGSPNTGAISGIGSSDFARISFAYTGVSGSNGLWIRQPTGQTASGTIYVRFPLFENATGRTDTTTPSEYVSSDVGLAVYATENGNSVASNVVTEAVGAALSPAPYVLTCPGATNSCAYSQDLTGTGWTTTGLVKAQDATDIFGNANSAWTIEDDNASAFEIAVYTTSITSSTNTHSVRAWFKKTVSASSFPGLQIRITGGATIDPGVAVNTDNGSLTNWTTAPDSKSIEDDGDYWKVTISVADTGVGNNQLALRIFAAVNTDASTFWNTSTTGSCVIDQAEIFLNTAHAVAHALSPIPTNGFASTTNATEVSIDWPTGLKNNFVVIEKINLPVLAGVGAIELRKDSNNRYNIYVPSAAGSVFVSNRVGGAALDAGHASILVAGTDHEYRALQSNSGGAVIYGSGSRQDDATGATNDIVLPDDGKLRLGEFNANVLSVVKHRDLQIWSVPAFISDAAVLALTP